MVVRAVKEDLEITEFDIEYHPREGESKLSSFRDGWRHLKLLLVNSPTALFMVPGLAILIVGLVGIVLSISGISLFGREWQIHATIAAALLTIVGAQIVALAVSAGPLPSTSSTRNPTAFSNGAASTSASSSA